MKFWFRSHHYHTQFQHCLEMLLFHTHLWRYLILFGHMEDCCDCWVPVTDPIVIRAFMLDDQLKLEIREKK